MEFSSLAYTYVVPGVGETRDPVILDCDFGPVFPTVRSRVILNYLAASGMRQNAAGSMVSPGEFSVRLIGDFGQNNSAVYTVAAPRTGDSVAQYNGITLALQSPFVINDYNAVFIPKTFQVEFIPSSSRGDAAGDTLTMFVTFGFLIL